MLRKRKFLSPKPQIPSPKTSLTVVRFKGGMCQRQNEKENGFR